MTASADWRGEVRVEADGEISGFVYDPADLARRFVVELQIDAQAVALMRASLFDVGLDKQGIGDGCYGFAFAPIEPRARAVVAVAVANSDRLVGALNVSRTAALPPSRPGRDGVRWLGGLRFEVWIEYSCPDLGDLVFAEIDGETIAADEPDVWAPVSRGAILTAARRREILLPPRFADGQMRRARFRMQSGRELAGSPCAFVAFGESLGSPRDSGWPRSAPFRAFDAWRKAYPSRQEGATEAPRVAVCLLGGGDLQASLKSLAGQARSDWIAASISCQGDSVDIDAKQALDFIEGEGASCEFVALAPSGAAFEAEALALLVSALIDQPSTPLAYSDIAIEAEDGSHWPLAFPAFDEERLLEQGYPARFFALRRSLAVDILREGATADVFGFFFAGLEGPGRPAPTHIPQFLATVPLAALCGGADRLAAAGKARLDALGVEGRVVPVRSNAILPHVRVTRTRGRDSVSLIVAASGSATLPVEQCLHAAAKAMRGREAEAILVGDRVSLSAFTRIHSDVHRIEIAPPASLMRAANAAVTATNGDLLVLLDPGYGDLDSDGMEELLGRASAPDAGAVGPLHVDEEGVVVSAGKALCPGLGALDAFADHPSDAPSYSDLLVVAHAVGALSAAGMVTRKTLFRAVDGFDLARLRRRFAEVDFCLKLRAQGARVLLAPAAKLVVRRPPSAAATMAGPFLRDLAEDAELRQLRWRWGEALIADPCYNPNLSLDRPYSGLAAPPRSRAPRKPDIASRPWPPPGF